MADYFLDGRHPGRWSRSAETLMGLSGAVRRSDLVAVLSGCDPRSGAFLPAHRPARRRAGWDLAFCSPKSLSLLAAISEQGGESVVGAHVGAVEAVIADLGAALPGAGLVAASFDHRFNAAGEPHIHTHVLVANLSYGDGRWTAVPGAPWYVDRRAIGALYHLALRAELGARGWDLDWRLRPDGLADLAEVPRSAVRAASTQSRLGASLGSHAARSRAEPQAWREKVTEAGLSQLPQPHRTAGRNLDDAGLARAVGTRLAVRRSDFRWADVVTALAATYPGGASPEEVRAWVGRFCESAVSVPSPTAGRRWTTNMARRADEELTRALGAHRRVRDPLVLNSGEERLLHHVAPSAWQAAEQLLTQPGPVQVLAAARGTSMLLPQAEAMHACREIWERAGQRVALCSPDRTGELRWSALSGLEPLRAGEPADVIVVDQADRRTTAELLRLSDQAAAWGARLVLIEGGTLPRVTNPASHGLAAATEAIQPARCGPHVPWQPEPTQHGPSPVGRDAAANALRAWLRGDDRTVLVGLGIEEVRGLNDSARRLIPTQGPSIGNRWGTLQAGQRAVVLRGGADRPPYGTFGTVEDVDSRQRSARIVWEGAPEATPCDATVLSGVGPGHAVTARLVACCHHPAVVLGPADSAPAIERSRILWSVSRATGKEGRRLEVAM